MLRGELRVVPAVPAERLLAGRWLLGLAGVGGLVDTVGLVVEVRCVVGRCPPPGLRRVFALDALWSLPRLFTTAVFVVAAVSAGLGWWAAAGRTGRWWALVAAGGAGLAVAKAVSVHSAVERGDGPVLTLVGGLVLTVVGLPLLLWVGLRWSVPGALPVCAALAGYAVAALGLDQVTAGLAAASANPVLRAFAVYLEEGGEALTALVLLAAVGRAVPVGRLRAQRP